MTTHTTVRSPGAIVLAAIFFLTTCFVLFEDVLRHNAEITTDHVMTMAVLIGTIAAGHMFWPQAAHFRVFPAIGLALLFSVGTFYCVTASAGRNAEATIAKASGVTKGNDDRARIEADILDAKERLNSALEAEARECGSGEGPKCLAQRKTRDERQTYTNVLEAQLRLMQPKQTENAGLNHAAKVFAALPWVTSTPEQIAEALFLFFPFVKATFLEVACIIFGGIGFGSERRQPVKKAHTLSDRWAQTDFPAAREADLGTVRAMISAPKGPDSTGYGGRTVRRIPDGPKPVSPAGKRLSKTETLQHVLTDLALGRTFPSQKALVGLCGRPKQTISDWMRDWERSGLVPARTQRGRCKSLTAAD